MAMVVQRMSIYIMSYFSPFVVVYQNHWSRAPVMISYCGVAGDRNMNGRGAEVEEHFHISRPHESAMNRNGLLTLFNHAFGALMVSNNIHGECGKSKISFVGGLESGSH